MLLLLSCTYRNYVFLLTVVAVAAAIASGIAASFAINCCLWNCCCC